MATRRVVVPCRQFLGSGRPTTVYLSRRTLTYTRPLRAPEDSKSSGTSENETQPRRSTFSSLKKLFLGGSDKSAEQPKVVHQGAAPLKREGSLSAGSIFAEDEAGPKLTPTGRTPTRRPTSTDAAETEQLPPESLEDRDRERMNRVLDPRPKARIQWERKMVARQIRRRGRLTKKEILLRTERDALVKSHWFKTSVKKLGPLARQIAGKNIDDAIIQMQFSKKKAAKDVLEHLKHAKNVAIVRHGMGIKEESGNKTTPVTVTFKSGERKTITDPTAIYIAQAWVNRGPYDVAWDHRAMGRIYMLRPPYTSLSVVLKEERTRIREWEDREAKALRQRKTQLWTQLPDRKIYGQNQYYSW